MGRNLLERRTIARLLAWRQPRLKLRWIKDWQSKYSLAIFFKEISSRAIARDRDVIAPDRTIDRSQPLLTSDLTIKLTCKLPHKNIKAVY